MGAPEIASDNAPGPTVQVWARYAEGNPLESGWLLGPEKVQGKAALVEVKRGGKTIPAVAQTTKMGLLFILDRLTGQPVFGVEERPVPKSETPGEESWPTEPFPVKPRINIRFFAVQAGGDLCVQQRNLCRFLNLTYGRPCCNETCGSVTDLICAITRR